MPRNIDQSSVTRRNFIAGTVVGTAAAASVANTAVAISSDEKTASSNLVTTPPVAMAPREDGMEIVWGISRHSRGWIELRDEKELVSLGGTSYGFSIQDEKVLRVRIHGLRPGTTYQYRTITVEMGQDSHRVESEWREFRTLSSAAKESRFAVWNDTHMQDETIKQLHARTSPEVDFLLWNGDICNDWHKEEFLAPTLLNPAGLDFTAKRPLAFVWGNHDLRGQFGYRLPSYAASPDGRSYYAFRSGPVAVVCLNTGEDKADDHPSFKGRVACEPLRREQAEWLREVVLKTPAFRDAPYRVVFCHIPLRWKDENDAGRDYDSFSRRSRNQWHDSLVAWSAQVIVSGHMHEAHWMKGTQDFPYAQLVGGGPKASVATLIMGDANPERLELTMTDMSGKVLAQPTFKPLST